jgi:long-chain fatty acid transport protein
MKKRLGLLVALLFVAGNVYAGSVDYLSNQSAKYYMTLSRNASTDASADIVHYNPAGTAFLEKGLYFDVSNQTLFKPYSTDSKTNMAAPVIPNRDETLKQNNDTYLLPDAYMVYNFGQVGVGNLAVYGQFGIVAGGGIVSWDKGTAGTTFALSAIAIRSYGTSQALGYGAAGFSGDIVSQKFEGSSIYYGGALGTSYSLLNNMLSISVGGRYVMADRSLKLDASYTLGTVIAAKYTYSATGFTPIVGLDVKPVSGLTIAARYEGETNLKFKYKQEKYSVTGMSTSQQTAIVPAVVAGILANSGIVDGGKFNYNLPQIFSFGVEYAVTPSFSVMTSANFYFLGQSDMGKVYDAYDGTVVSKLNKYFGTGYELALGATYNVISDLKIGAGFMYTESGAKDSYFNNQYTILVASGNPPLDSYAIGLGLTYNVIKNLDLTLSGLYTHYIPFDYKIAVQGGSAGAISSMSGTYKKDVYAIGFGVGYKL